MGDRTSWIIRIQSSGASGLELADVVRALLCPAQPRAAQCSLGVSAGAHVECQGWWGWKCVLASCQDIEALFPGFSSQSWMSWTGSAVLLWAGGHGSRGQWISVSWAFKGNGLNPINLSGT